LLKGESPLSSKPKTNNLLVDHFRCPEGFVDLTVGPGLSGKSGYFRLGPENICFGQSSSVTPADNITDPLPDQLAKMSSTDANVDLPFDPAQVLDNLRHERYPSQQGTAHSANKSGSLVRSLYYRIRPILPVALRKHLQRIYLRNWEDIPFPHWPVDFSVENLLERLIVISMQSRSETRIPFIWFWPEGAPSCTVVTHDVEQTAGWEFCPQLMDLDDSFGIKSSFQIVPEERYTVTEERLALIRERGFEINVHDLNHDGNLFLDREEFLRRAAAINRYKDVFRAKGFRTAILYRKIDWFDALDFSYDLSVPNVAHLEPQRGGCCTVFPFFNGKMIELPVTMAQDYSLFNILKDYSINLWKQQMSLIRARNGLMQMIVHPDYIIDEKARRVYADLLRYIAELRDGGETWVALPAEVAEWWRLRSKLALVKEAGGWQIKGEGRERARIAYACIRDGKLTYEFEAKDTRTTAGADSAYATM